MPRKSLYPLISLRGLVRCGIAAVLTIMAMTACSNIDEAERLRLISTDVIVNNPDTIHPDSLYDAPVAVVDRCILIEDHTGQRCPNCPDGTAIIRKLQRIYGQRIVPVAIHSQMQGIMEPEGLGNELGNELYRQWNIEYKPAALFNRFEGTAYPKTLWEQAVDYLISDTTPCPLDIRIKILPFDDLEKANIDVKVIATTDTVSVKGRLQVWLTEDHIEAVQDSTNNVHFTDYVHNHVLRVSANGTTGDDVALNGLADQQEFHYAVDLSPSWKPENMAVVAFVYNSQGVLQVAKRNIILTRFTFF